MTKERNFTVEQIHEDLDYNDLESVDETIGDAIRGALLQGKDAVMKGEKCQVGINATLSGLEKREDGWWAHEAPFFVADSRGMTVGSGWMKADLWPIGEVEEKKFSLVDLDVYLKGDQVDGIKKACVL